MSTRQYILVMIGAAIVFSFSDDITRFVGRFADPTGAARHDKIEQASREDTFRTLCPEYFEMGFARRVASDRRWCEDYRERI
ncbi:hypothetical protein [Rhizobium laguerreae]|uniref:hypothetical protein n=1 Tax=Rhizobium laguerreae TaxID=1076926 RepID=UPI001C91A56F|nr:hypothetical protein [Rhizobium laguerreae]MBY3314761.1 hypothetical protein [Rhizobium laguerreae]